MSRESISIPAVDDPAALFEVFCGSCGLYTDRTASILRAGAEEKTVSYRTLFGDACCLSNAFLEKGLKSGASSNATAERGSTSSFNDRRNRRRRSSGR